MHPVKIYALMNDALESSTAGRYSPVASLLDNELINHVRLGLPEPIASHFDLVLEVIVCCFDAVIT